MHFVTALDQFIFLSHFLFTNFSFSSTRLIFVAHFPISVHLFFSILTYSLNSIPLFLISLPQFHFLHHTSLLMYANIVSFFSCSYAEESTIMILSALPVVIPIPNIFLPSSQDIYNMILFHFTVPMLQQENNLPSLL